MWGIWTILSLFASLTSIDFCFGALIHILVHLIYHAVQFLLLVVNFDFGAVKHHITILDGRELGSAHWALQLCLTPFVDAREAKLMAATIDLGQILLAKANAALESWNGGGHIISLAGLEKLRAAHQYHLERKACTEWDQSDCCLKINKASLNHFWDNAWHFSKLLKLLIISLNL